jgi:uncharacterized protein GlcG (DUF336 family)
MGIWLPISEWITFLWTPSVNLSAKAVAAAESASPSGEKLSDDVYYPLTGMVVVSGVPDIRSRGGLPVIRGGKLEGAIGVSGTQTDEQDEECARAEVEALIGDE